MNIISIGYIRFLFHHWASANQTQPYLTISHGHTEYVFHQPIKHNHISQWAMAILDMCCISQSNTTMPPHEQWPYWICVSSANHTQPFLLMSRGQMGYVLHQPIIMDFSSIIFRPIRNSIFNGANIGCHILMTQENCFEDHP